jgi:hypothetical protein
MERHAELPGAGDDEIIAEAETSLGKTHEERAEMFRSIQDLVSAVWAGLSEEEMRRRLEIADLLDPRPDPWWKDVRPEGW